MRRYLIVDDNLAFAENLAEILRDAGAEVATASGGALALKLAAAQRFDALITDMRMPFMNGATLVHELRRVDPGLPAIVITAFTGETDLVAARQEGLLAVLPKPAPIELLIELVAIARRDALVALVEDDSALCDNLSEALRDRGFSAVAAHSVTETDRLGPVRPFAALVDLRMPGGPDGEAMRRLSRRFPGLPLFIMTAHAEIPAAAQRPLQVAVEGTGQGAPVGAAEMFVKPFDTARILSVLEHLHQAQP